MHYSMAVVAALAGLSIASPAVPVEIRDKKAFSVKQVSTGKKVPKVPALEVLKAYTKYGKHAPASVAAAAAAATGEVVANSVDGDEEYVCPVTVGSQTLNLDFDTGSADLWVFSNKLPSSESSGHDLYNPNDGTSTLKSGYTWDISYGDGSGAKGIVYADKVVVGGVTATSQAVEAATSVSSTFISDTASDGLLGLAFSSINTVSPTMQTTFFDTVKANLAKQLFTADLKKGGPGAYDFGYIDSSKYTGAITYVPVNTANGFWEFTASGYKIGSGSSVSTAIGNSIADTGTTLLYLPAALVKAYYAKVSGSSNSASEGGYIFPCSATLPNLSIVIGGATFTVPGSYINFVQVSQGSKSCFGGLQANTGIGFSIFGDIFLKSQFVVFDETTSSPRLGFAAQ